MQGPLNREQVRELDRRAIEEYGIPSALLMENAGRACADAAEELLAGAPRGQPVVVLCGPGNNGGDGLVIARTLHNRGHRVVVWFVGPLERLERLSDDVRLNAALWRALGKRIHGIERPEHLVEFGPRLEGAALIVDALFGTGLQRPLEGLYAGVVGAANAAPAPILAVDLPSGLDANSGEVLGTAIEARATVSFVAEKPGFALAAGPRLCGRVSVAEIGIPRAFLEELDR